MIDLSGLGLDDSHWAEASDSRNRVGQLQPLLDRDRKSGWVDALWEDAIEGGLLFLIVPAVVFLLKVLGFLP